MYNEAQRIVKLYNEDRASYDNEVGRRKALVMKTMNFDRDFSREIVAMSRVIANKLGIQVGGWGCTWTQIGLMAAVLAGSLLSS